VPLQLTQVRVDGRRETLLAPVDLVLSRGERVLLAAEPGHGHTALALAATGRLRPDAGRVALTGADAADPAGGAAAGADDGAAEAAGAVTDVAALRAATAVVDVPGVDEPDEALTVGALVAEGLAYAGRRALPRDVRAWLADVGGRWAPRWTGAAAAQAVGAEAPETRGGLPLDPAPGDAAALRRRRVDALPALVRTTLLAELAATRPGVRFLVLALPDRHGGHPAGWWEAARDLAARGLGVLVLATPSSARDLGADVPPTRGLHAPPLLALRSREVVLAAAPAENPEAAEAPDPETVREGERR
jgi:energy-coupling factor transporter ATP-binding protein EcfA2